MSRPLSDHAAWEAANGEFLAASLHWLRLLLLGARTAEPPDGPPVDLPEVPGSWRSRRRQSMPSVEPPLRAPAPPVTAAQIANAAQAVTDAERMSPPPALVTLAETFGLTRFERDTLLLCAATELDPSLGDLCASVQGQSMAFPTFALALRVLPDPAWSVLSPQRGLRYWRLVEINQHSGQTLTASGLRADERIVNVIKCLNYVDDRLEPLLTPLDPDLDADLPASHESVLAQMIRQWQAVDGPTAVVQLAGADRASKQLVAAHAAARCGLLAYRLPAALLPAAATELDNLARLWQRESMLLPIALFLDVEDAGQNGETRPPVAQFLQRLHCPTLLATRESWPDVGSYSTVVDVAPPTTAERAAAWRAALGPAAGERQVLSLAAQFALDVPSIRVIAAGGGTEREVWRACKSRTRPQLDALAQRLEPRVDWADLVLPGDELRMLRQIAEQVTHRLTVYDTWGFGERITRGLGVSALFTGPSGTGKTMAAEVLANHLDLDLYRVDLSAVVSKYIGETEKNLRRLFDAAEGGGVILFFDEADALFGKRNEVKDAHDRYANTQTNDLLQRMEAYSGLSILATNMRRALDGAFIRRLRFIVEFPFPGLAERRIIWQRVFPDASPRDDLDFDRLAALPLAGGPARNVALNAAFLASAAGTAITMPAVLAAARSEFRKLELPIRERDFAWSEERVP
ncbi:ATP-binding protein [Actinoplanes sp. CA-051413]|uniref:ATP-binding protein n=1 Tax=Actinoplanes sp. CA-051413 TaxID=3239899 RepID=UPI003D99396F